MSLRYEGEFSQGYIQEMPHTVLVGDPPKNNRVQQFLRDILGLSQDCESGNIVVQLIGSNIAALANNIRKISKHQVNMANTLQADGEMFRAHDERLKSLERRLSYYEQHAETIAYQKRKLDRIIAAEREISAEPRIEEPCPICLEPIGEKDLVQRMETPVGAVFAHMACVEKLMSEPPTDMIVRPDGEAISTSLANEFSEPKEESKE